MMDIKREYPRLSAIADYFIKKINYATTQSEAVKIIKAVPTEQITPVS
jgi:hypothetical protein